MQNHCCGSFRAPSLGLAGHVPWSPADQRGAGGPAPKSGGPVDRSVLEDLAAAARILAAEGVVDAFGHVSIRHPKEPGRFLMSRSMAPALQGPDDIIEYDLHSTPVNANGRNSFLERFIHGEIYRARPDVMSVVHSHSPSVIPYSLTGLPMKAMYHNAAHLAAGVPIFRIEEKFGATDMLVGNNDKGIELARIMGKSNVVLMRAHGSVASGPNLQLAVFRAVYTEVSARVQQAALLHNLPIAALSTEEGRLADLTNETACMRAWELWRGKIKF
ncbi:MAG: class II aldolase/adducin family protein [Hyphomicrobiaceae bacterium]